MWSSQVGFSLCSDGEPLQYLRLVSSLHDQSTGCLQCASAMFLPMLPNNVRQVLELIGLRQTHFEIR